MKSKLFMAFLCLLMLSGCSISPIKQMKICDACHSSGYECEYVQNKQGRIEMINCLPVSIASEK